MDNLTMDYILRKEVWEEYQEDRYNAENEIALKQLNKLHNRKGYTFADYENSFYGY